MATDCVVLSSFCQRRSRFFDLSAIHFIHSCLTVLSCVWWSSWTSDAKLSHCMNCPTRYDAIESPNCARDQTHNQRKCYSVNVYVSPPFGPIYNYKSNVDDEYCLYSKEVFSRRPTIAIHYSLLTWKPNQWMFKHDRSMLHLFDLLRQCVYLCVFFLFKVL